MRTPSHGNAFPPELPEGELPEGRLEERLRTEAAGAFGAPPADLAARVCAALRAHGASPAEARGRQWRRLVPLLAAAACAVLQLAVLLARGPSDPGPAGEAGDARVARDAGSPSEEARSAAALPATPVPAGALVLPGGLPLLLTGPLAFYDGARPALRSVVDDPLRGELASLWSEGARAVRGVALLVPAPLRERLQQRPH